MPLVGGNLLNFYTEMSAYNQSDFVSVGLKGPKGGTSVCIYIYMPYIHRVLMALMKLSFPHVYGPR
jgi:hypothetical protein